MGKYEKMVRNGVSSIYNVCSTDLANISNKLSEDCSALIATSETSNANVLLSQTLESVQTINYLLNDVVCSLKNSSAISKVNEEAKRMDNRMEMNAAKEKIENKVSSVRNERNMLK